MCDFYAINLIFIHLNVLFFGRPLSSDSPGIPKAGSLDRYRIESTGFSDATLCDRQQEDDHERLSVKMGREFEQNPHGRKERGREELEEKIKTVVKWPE